MNAQRLALSVCFIFGLAVAAHAEEKKLSKEKLVGAWICTEGKGIEGATISFTKDGKGTVAFKADGKEVKEDFKFEIDGDTVKVTSKGPDGKDETTPYKIKTLTDKEMVSENDKGEIAKFKKKID
jgi:uncharacterized protein (TIGR03066 family)